MQKTVSVLKDLVVLLRDMSVIALFAVFLLFQYSAAPLPAPFPQVE